MSSYYQSSNATNDLSTEKFQSQLSSQNKELTHAKTNSKLTSQNDKDIKISKHDISNSLLGKSIRQFNNQLNSRLTKQYLDFLRDKNNQEVSSRHGFIRPAKQFFKYKNNLAKDFFLNINEFYNVIDQEDDNELEVIFPSYDLKFWEPIFRQTLINWINGNLVSEKAVVGITLQQAFLDFNQKKFVIKKGINIMKPFDVTSTLLQIVNSLALRLQSKEKINISQKINEIFKEFYSQKTVESLEKYEKMYRKYLKDIEQEKKSRFSAAIQMENIIYKTNKTIFKESNNETLILIRRQNQLKLLNIKFHCIMIRCFYLQASYRRRDLALKPHYAFKNEYQKIDSLKKIYKTEATQQKEKKNNLQDLDEEERLIIEIGEFKNIMRQYQEDIISISHVNKSMDQFQKLIRQQKLEISSDNEDQIFKIESRIQQTLTNLEAVIVTEIRYIEIQDLIPREYQQSIQFLFNQDDLLIFIQVVDSFMVELNRNKVYKDEIPTFIKTKVPEMKLLLSYANQTSFILNKIIDDYHQYFQDSLKKAQNMSMAPQDMWKKQSQGTWQIKIKDIFQHMALFNYVAISYQFSRQEPFHLNYFCVNEGLTKPRRYHSTQSKHIKLTSKISKHVDNKIQQMSSIESKTLKKLDFFWQTFKLPQILLRIYEHSTLSFKEIKQMPNNRKSTFQALFFQYADINEIRQYKVRYIVHFSQYFLEIISDLSSAQNTSLTAIFNVCRFLILNFVCFFYIQSVKRIEKEIKEKHGDQYYQIVKNQMSVNKRILENNGKVVDALRLSGEKIKRYINQAKNDPTPSTNSRKLDKIFDDFKSIKKLFEKLNCQSPIKNEKVNLKKPEDALRMEYDFDIARETYLAVVRLMAKEYLTKAVLQRILKKIIPIAKEQANLVKSKTEDSVLLKQWVKYSQKSQNTNKLELFVEPKTYDTLQSYQVYFQKFALSFLQMAKLTSMILSMPFYSYENQVEYMRKRRLDKDDLKKFEKQKGKLLYSLDVFYIYQRQRINAEFMGKSMKNFQFINIFGIYMKNVNQLFSFMSLKTNAQKLKIVKKQQSINIQGMFFKHPKYLHNDIMSIYSKLELEEFFFSFNQKTQESIPFKLQPDLRRSLEYFFQLCNKMGKRAIDICMENKKKYQAQDSKKVNFNEMKPVKEESFQSQNSDEKTPKNETKKRDMSKTIDATTKHQITNK